MPATKYTYSIATDFLNQTVATDRLSKEITTSAITIALDYITTSGDNCDIWFKNSISIEEEGILDTIVGTHTGNPLSAPAQPVELKSGEYPIATDSKRLRVAIEKPDQPSVTIYTHDWTDPTTWYQQSSCLIDTTPIRVSSKIYRLLHENIIDTYHGNLTNEDFLVDENNHSYRVIVKKNGNTLVEDDPHIGINSGDYHINYASGTIFFKNDVNENDVILVSYHYANNSIFTVKPDSGKVLRLEVVEVQFSRDVVLNDTVKFQPRGYCIAFAPQLAQSNGGPYPDLTKIPLGNPVVYKTMSDFQNDALKAYPGYPAIGGSGWRGMYQEVFVFDWDYLRTKPLYHSLGMEVQVFLEHDVPFGGYYATATFYCTSESE